MTASTPSPTISAAPPTWAAADWNALRATGLAYVERYAHSLWTDYNRHDPGVTTLELLCYAITDLSQRTSLDVKDLLRSSYGSDAAMARSFLAAHEALPTEPVTELDYRKLLIDVPGVRNAWLRPHPLPVALTLPDAQLYTDLDSILLDEPGTHAQLYYPGTADQRPAFEVRGFYDITVDLDSVMVNLAAYYMHSSEYDDYVNTYNTLHANDLPQPLPLLVPTSVPAAMALVMQALADQAVPEGALQDLERPTDGADDTAWAAQRAARQEVREGLLAMVRTAYLNHRNLGEDCFSVGEVPEQGLVLCADIDLAPGAQVREVYAQLLLAVDQYLTPPVKRYSLAEMQALTDADGQPLALDQIFEGPLLANGFIREEDLTASALRQNVYVSDLVALAMEVPGIVAVRDLRVSALLRTPAPDATHDDAYDVDPQRSGLAWHLPIPAGSRPQLHAAASTLNFYQGVLPVLTGSGPDKTAALARFADLRAQAQADLARRLDAVPVAVPTGTDHPDLGTYRPLAHDFTANYGLAPNGLPDDASPERHNQVRQFKAYLLFFDQLLSNYLAQLLHVKDLLGTDAAARDTYFGQQLREADLPGLNELYKDIAALGENPLPADIAAIDTAGIAPDVTDRKSRFLDHLLARFAEDFTEYGLLLYALNGQRSEAEVLLTKTDLAADLGRFQPARAFRYQEPSWVRRGGTTGSAALAGANVAGIVRRFARLAGLSNYQARPTTYSRLPIEAFPVIDAHANLLAPLLKAAGSLTVKKIDNNNFGYEQPNHQILTQHALRFPTRAAAEATLARAEMAIRTHLETIFVVEHALLLPDIAAPDLPEAWLPVCAEPDGSFCEPLDPYSFRVSIVLPGYAGRFYDPDYRRYAERILRLELPAHVMARICWVSELDLQKFEYSYVNWLATKTSSSYPPADKSAILADFVNALNSLTTVYPAGKLYDCEHPIADNPLVLGRTIMGDPGAKAEDEA